MTGIDSDMGLNWELQNILGSEKKMQELEGEHERTFFGFRTCQ